MNILIVKTSAIGDVIQSFDVLEYLKSKFPSSKIDWVVSPNCVDLVAAHPLIRKVICVDVKGVLKNISWKQSYQELRKESYDVLFDLQGNVKSGIISFFCKAKHKVGFGFKSVAEWPNLLFTSFHYNISKKINIKDQYVLLLKRYFKDEIPFFPPLRFLNIESCEKEKIDLILEKMGPRDSSLKILVCPSSRWKSKMLTKDLLSSFLREIAKKKEVFYLLLWGNEEEKEFAAFLNRVFPENSLVLEKLRLPTLQHLVNRLDFVISVDSFLLHLAASVKIPSFGIFGPTSSSVYMPQTKDSVSYQGKCPFRKRFEKRCSNLRSCRSPGCMEGIKLNDLCETIWSHILFK